MKIKHAQILAKCSERERERERERDGDRYTKREKEKGSQNRSYFSRFFSSKK